MLVIGIDKDGSVSHKDLDIDTDTDSPRQIHDKLKKACDDTGFDTIIVVSGEDVEAVYQDQADYDLSEPPDEDEAIVDDLDSDPDLDDDDEDSNDDDDENDDDQ